MLDRAASRCRPQVGNATDHLWLGSLFRQRAAAGGRNRAAEYLRPLRTGAPSGLALADRRGAAPPLAAGPLQVAGLRREQLLYSGPANHHVTKLWAANPGCSFRSMRESSHPA